jgi:hypothetical protein
VRHAHRLQRVGAARCSRVPLTHRERTSFIVLSSRWRFSSCQRLTRSLSSFEGADTTTGFFTTGGALSGSCCTPSHPRAGANGFVGDVEPLGVGDGKPPSLFTRGLRITGVVCMLCSRPAFMA